MSFLPCATLRALKISCEIVGEFNCDFKKSLAPSIKMACDQT